MKNYKKLLNFILSLLMTIGLTTNARAEGPVEPDWGGSVGTVFKVEDVNETDPQSFADDGKFFVNGQGSQEQQLTELQNKLNSYLDAGYVFADENAKVPETVEEFFDFSQKYGIASQQNMPEHTDEQTIKLKHRMDEKTETTNVQTSDEKAYRTINFVFNGEESKNYTEKQYGSGEIVETWTEDAVTKKESSRETTSQKSQFIEYSVPEVDGWTADKTVVEEKEYDGTWAPEETITYNKKQQSHNFDNGAVYEFIDVDTNEIVRKVEFPRQRLNGLDRTYWPEMLKIQFDMASGDRLFEEGYSLAEYVPFETEEDIDIFLSRIEAPNQIPFKVKRNTAPEMRKPTLNVMQCINNTTYNDSCVFDKKNKTFYIGDPQYSNIKLQMFSGAYGLIEKEEYDGYSIKFEIVNEENEVVYTNVKPISPTRYTSSVGKNYHIGYAKDTIFMPIADFGEGDFHCVFTLLKGEDAMKIVNNDNSMEDFRFKVIKPEINYEITTSVRIVGTKDGVQTEIKSTNEEEAEINASYFDKVEIYDDISINNLHIGNHSLIATVYDANTNKPVGGIDNYEYISMDEPDTYVDNKDGTFNIQRSVKVYDSETNEADIGKRYVVLEINREGLGWRIFSTVHNLDNSVPSERYTMSNDNVKYGIDLGAKHFTPYSSWEQVEMELQTESGEMIDSWTGKKKIKLEPGTYQLIQKTKQYKYEPTKDSLTFTLTEVGETITHSNTVEYNAYDYTGDGVKTSPSKNFQYSVDMYDELGNGSDEKIWVNVYQTKTNDYKYYSDVPESAWQLIKTVPFTFTSETTPTSSATRNFTITTEPNDLSGHFYKIETSLEGQTRFSKEREFSCYFNINDNPECKTRNVMATGLSRTANKEVYILNKKVPVKKIKLTKRMSDTSYESFQFKFTIYEDDINNPLEVDTFGMRPAYYDDRELEVPIGSHYRIEELAKDGFSFDHLTITDDSGSIVSDNPIVEDIATDSGILKLDYVNKIKDKKDIKITKEWIDTDESLRPDAIAIKLLKDGKEQWFGTLRKQENYSMTFKNYPIFNEQGDKIEYSIEELYAGEGYQLKEIKETNEGFTLVNEYKPKKTTITLSKELLGKSDKDKFGIYILPFTDNFHHGHYLKYSSWGAHNINVRAVGDIATFLEDLQEYDKTADIKLYPAYSKLFDQDFINEMKAKIENASIDNSNPTDGEVFTEEEMQKLNSMCAYFFGWYDMSEITQELQRMDPDFYINNGVDNFATDLNTYWHGGLYYFSEAFRNDISMVGPYEDGNFQDYVNKAILNNKLFYYEISAGETKTIELPNEVVHLIIIEEDSEGITEFEPIYYGDADATRLEIYGDSQPKTEFEYHLVNRGTFTPEITNTTVKVGESIATTEKEATYELGVKEDGVELSDTVEYEGLDDELTYTIKSTLYSDDEEVQTKSTEVKNQNKGSVTVVFDEKVQEGTFDVKTELLLDNKVVFTHNEELNTKLERATITREIPEDGTLKTTVEGASKSKSGELTAEEASKKTSLTDTISYEGLIGGESYTVVGRLMENGETEVATVSETMKADESGNGEWKVTFTFKEGTLKPNTKYVVFEKATQVVPEGRTSQTAKHEDPTDIAQTVVVAKAKFPVSILKTDLGGTEVEGATIRVEGDGFIEVWESTKEPHEMKLPVGEYKMTEKAAPTGYIPVETEITFTVDEEGNTTVEEVVIDGETYTEMKDGVILLKNAKAKEYVNTQVTKVWKNDTGEDIEWSVDEIKVLVEYGNESEELTLTKDMPTLPTKDFEKSEDTEFKVTELTELEDFTTKVEKTEEGYVITNTKKPTSDIKEPPVTFTEIEVVKYAEDTKQPLKGAEITLFDENDEVVLEVYSNKPCVAVTDENGKVTFYVESYKYKNVYAKETKAPEGYLINEEKFKIELIDVESWIENTSIDIYDKPIKTEKTVVNVEVVKYAKDTKLPLKDAEITIFTEDGEVALDVNGKECIALTDENGKAVFQIYKEDYPSVYVKETKAPEGYRINDNKFDLDTSAEIVNVTVDIYDMPITTDAPTPTPEVSPTPTPTPTEVRKSSVSTGIAWPLTASVVLVGAVAFMFYVLKKKEDKE